MTRTGSISYCARVIPANKPGTDSACPIVRKCARGLGGGTCSVSWTDIYEHRFDRYAITSLEATRERAARLPRHQPASADIAATHRAAHTGTRIGRKDPSPRKHHGS